jgi:hypothetical protein
MTLNAHARGEGMLLPELLCAQQRLRKAQLESIRGVIFSRFDRNAQVGEQKNRNAQVGEKKAAGEESEKGRVRGMVCIIEEEGWGGLDSRFGTT